MPEHYPKNVKLVMVWCPTCNRKTMHRTDFKRLGSCTEHGVQGLSRAQLKRRAEAEAKETQPDLL